MYVCIYPNLNIYVRLYVSSPYLFVFGDDHVMRYTGEDDVAGGPGEA